MSTITRGFSPMSDRYVFDFKLCIPAKGWAHNSTPRKIAK